MKGNPIFNGTEPETRMYSKPFEELYYEDTPRIAELRESVRRAKRDFLCFHLRNFGDVAGIGLNLLWRDWRKFAIVLNFPYWYIGHKFYYDSDKNVVKGRLFKFVAIGLAWKLGPEYIFKTDTCRIGSEQTVIQSGPDVLRWLSEETMTPFDRLVRDEGLHEEPWGKENP